jgi:hypothetical protein
LVELKLNYGRDLLVVEMSKKKRELKVSERLEKLFLWKFVNECESERWELLR